MEIKTDFRSSGGKGKEGFMYAGPSCHAELILLVEGLYLRGLVLTGKLVQVTWEWPCYKIPLEGFQRKWIPDEVNGILGSGCPDTHRRLQVGWKEEADTGPRCGFPIKPWMLLLCTRWISHSDEKHSVHSTYGNHIFQACWQKQPLAHLLMFLLRRWLFFIRQFAFLQSV